LERVIDLANLLHDELGDSRYIGIMLPPSAVSTITNIAVSIIGRIPVNLNHTESSGVLEAQVAQCQISDIITSFKFLESVHINSSAILLPIEVLEDKISFVSTALTVTEADVMPEELLGRFFPGLSHPRPNSNGAIQTCSGSNDGQLEDTATVIFTAGSTGKPKGVILSHRNILSSIHALQLHLELQTQEAIASAVPFHNAAGFTLACWGTLCAGHTAVFLQCPLETAENSQLIKEAEASMVLCTSVQLPSYISLMEAGKSDQFESLRIMLVTGGPIPPELIKLVKERHGLTILQSYGSTETSSLVTCNKIFKSPESGKIIPAYKPGTSGLPLPGTEFRILNMATSGEVQPGTTGIISVRGPQVMKGYLGNPLETTKVYNDGWLITDDLGSKDEEGFLTVSAGRFTLAMVAGEIVPLPLLEKEILRITGRNTSTIAVISLPDPMLGERIVVVYTDLGMPPGELLSRLAKLGVRQRWIPEERDFVNVSSLPLLHNGNPDLREIRQLALLNVTAPELLAS
jgi:acyl-[acyl-carrier-protein]-phospholipid O-acyltransferase/long-chain-fatty-acid--[acyl-carrier-protein] ligase